MKQSILFVLVLMCTAVFGQVGKQGRVDDTPKPKTPPTVTTDQSTNPVIRKCCTRIYYSAPATVTGKATTRLVSGNMFKGQNRGVDLTFDFLDPKGAVINGLDAAIGSNGSGDVVIDGSKLPKGQKVRLRARAGKASETYTLN